MRLATLRTGDSTVAVRIDGDVAVDVPGYADVGALLADPAWFQVTQAASGTERALAGIDPASWAAVVPRPSKIVCVGLNYRNHILEMGRELPAYPTLFAKYAEALIGPFDPIVLPVGAADAVDFEGELAVIIGRSARRVSETEAEAAIAGYSVLNDVTMRTHQYRTTQWLQGKTFEGTTPVGPYLVTRDEYALDTELRTEVDDQIMQRAPTSDLVFTPKVLVAYISTIITLNPGDVIATGTPGGVGHARKPPRYLQAGETLTTTIEGIGTLINLIRAEETDAGPKG